MAVHLHIDPFSGIAGDMFLGALIHLGVPVESLKTALAGLPIDEPYQISAKQVSRHGISAMDLKVTAGPGPKHRRFYDLLKMVEQLDTSARGRDRARRVLTTLAEAEAHVHGKPLDEIHFHEVGAIDSIVDLLGSVVGLELLGVDTLSCGPLPFSYGIVHCEHGIMPIPAPATAELMRGLPTVGVERRGELVTPTGAALVVGLKAGFGAPPPMTIQAIGYGAGDRDDPEAPNVLRLVLAKVPTRQS